MVKKCKDQLESINYPGSKWPLECVVACKRNKRTGMRTRFVWAWRWSGRQRRNRKATRGGVWPSTFCSHPGDLSQSSSLSSSFRPSSCQTRAPPSSCVVMPKVVDRVCGCRILSLMGSLCYRNRIKFNKWSANNPKGIIKLIPCLSCWKKRQ